jgi:uncharacterized protein YndB with AHSA1/START domain
MAYTARQIAADRDTVFAVLADPHTYPAWLVGNAEVQEVDADWPRPGSAFRHRVGVWPLTITDVTTLDAIEPTRMLRLLVRARPLIRAVATFRLAGDGDTTFVSLEEEPAVRFIGALVRPVVDPIIHFRNHASLRRLAAFVEDAQRDGAIANGPWTSTPS